MSDALQPHRAPVASGRPAREPNRLARETSPYLLQHAHNPVDWFPWGDDAFAQARRRGVPIFLSIGYSTCYWCHVMERESFEDDRTAAKMNSLFVCVKVDREERPDVDDAYMTATQVMSGRGGWPMSVFLDPDSLRPFWCGTYFPPVPGRGMPSFAQVLDAVSNAWRTKRDEVLAQAEELASAVREVVGTAAPAAQVGAEDVRRAVEDLLRSFDRNHGGFGGAPKFPQPVFLDLLLIARASAGDDATREAIDAALRTTLDRMAIGGLFDQAGGGFHRYCVDATWTVPHFEKMLYDNALLAGIYTRAAAAYGDDFYRRTAQRTLDYLRREMTAPEGAFFSAQDAEVNGREGENYVWTAEQFRAAIPEGDAAWAAGVYGLDRGPNFRDLHHPDGPAANVLRLADRPEVLAAASGAAPEGFLARLDRVNAALLAARRLRPSPRTDDKILSAWNGLAIAAFAEAGALLSEPTYTAAAESAAAFIEARMIESGVLMRAWREGRARIPAFLEDHACLVRGLVALHRAGVGGGRWLALAQRLSDAAWREFHEAGGVLYDTRRAAQDLFIRTRSVHDGAIPSGSAVMLHALIDLHETGIDGALARAVEALRGLSGAIARSPSGCAHAAAALLRLLRTPGAELHQALADAHPRGQPVSAAGAPGPDFTPVEVFADAERLSVRDGDPAAVQLVLRIAPGYHVNAADPGVSGLVPLRVGIAGGTGVAAFADYPAGEPLDGEGPRVHVGQVEFPVLVEKTGTVRGRPLLTLTFQACTQSECLAPTTVELDVAIDAG